MNLDKLLSAVTSIDQTQQPLNFEPGQPSGLF